MTQGAASRDRARVVVVTGAPGSGKTTLGTDLSRALRIPFMARDDVRGGLFFTAGSWSARPRRVPTPEESAEAFLRMRVDRLLNRQPVLDALGYTTIDEHTRDAVARMRSVAKAMRVDFGLPTLRVNTDDGYEPGLDDIVEFVTTGM
jgi:predicted kinase